MTPTTSLPLPMNTPATAQPVASPVASPSASAEQGQTADFLMMLAQLVGASVPAASAPVASQVVSGCAPDSVDETPAAETAEPDALVAMFSLSLPVTPIEIQPTATATGDASAVLKLAADVLQGQTAAIRNPMEVPTELMETEPTATTDSPSVTFDSMLAPTTASEAQHAAKAAIASNDAAISRPVHTPVGSAAWADEIGSRLTLMAEQGKHTASLRLSPEHLGPLEIRIAIRDDQASVWFGAAHADTRAAIETALPRLRELFESQGLSLADAGVFREPPREQPTFVSSSPSDGASANTEDASAVVASRMRLGLVDAYA